MPGAGPPGGGAEGVIAMRRIAVIVALGALLGLFAGVVTASPALARGPKWLFAPAAPFTLPASFCGFTIRVSFPVNKGYSKILKTTDGSMTTLITGASTVSNTNLSTGKTITVNLSGPEKVTAFPDGSATLRAKGRSAYALSPTDARRFGVPPLGVTAGAQTVSFAPDGSVTSFSLRHLLVDVCAALS
jgi:hypothetical protein